jgi:hypothetical protein
MKKIVLIFVVFSLFCSMAAAQKRSFAKQKDSEKPTVEAFHKEIFSFLKDDGLNPFDVNNHHIRFMYEEKQYNLVIYDGEPPLVRIYTVYSDILPLSDTTQLVIHKPDGVDVSFQNKTFRFSMDTDSLDIEPFKYGLYNQINLMSKTKVTFSYPEHSGEEKPKLTYDHFNYTRKRISEGVDSFEIICSDGTKIPFNMVYVKGGSYKMGNPEIGTTTTTVDDFYICDVEVSRRLWELVMNYVPSPYRGLKADVDYPVNYISWNDAQRFLKKFSTLMGIEFRMPTEAEWEYAARGGAKSHGYKYSGSDKMQEVAVIMSLTYKPAPIKSKKPNELGIYDMSGNVAEWCSGEAERDTKPVRGGSFATESNLCKVYETVDRSIDYRESSTGLRFVFSVK